jgi:serine/threonine-protein kinase
MRLAAGRRLGAYEIVAPIGEGGMGEVYRARDTRLNRDVALKVLPESIAHDPIRHARFEREAQAISRLNHPNICAVYDIGSHDGISYIVMEYIDGESLATHIRRGPIPVRTALKWAIQIAGALDAAHRGGVIHRDLKPANVMVSGTDTAKLLDFGLAKFGDESEAREPGAAIDPTLSLTAERKLVGSLHYMAPEQLDGRAVDPRTDLYALGAVLYEMITGRKAFDGSSDASVIAAILTAEPPPLLSSERSGMSAALDHVVRRALAKNLDERWQTARDLRNELQWVFDGGSPRAAARKRTSTLGRAGLLIGAAVAALTLILLAARPIWRSEPPTSPPDHLAFDLPPATVLTNTGRQVLAIAPDGVSIVFNANSQLYLRRLDAREPVPIAGTQGTGVRTPFFSPDGRWVAFFKIETSELQKIPVTGGTAITICRQPKPVLSGDFGASWTVNDDIFFALQEGVFKVPASGGIPERVIAAGPGETIYGPQLLPDRDHLLLTVTTASGPDRWDHGRVVAHSLSSGARTTLIDGGADGRYVDSGHILYAVGSTLYALGFDVPSLAVLGTPMTVLKDVRRSQVPAVNTGSAFVATSKTGTLVYIPETATPMVTVVVDQTGHQTPLLATGLTGMRVSPDGAQIAATSGDSWWIFSPTRASPLRRLAPAEGAYSNPVWTPDGKHITFRARTQSGSRIVSRQVDGTGAEQVLLPADGVPVGWSADGTTLFYISDRHLWSWTGRDQPKMLMSMDSPYASLSPDRRWVAFHTSEGGRVIPYIQSLSDPSARFQVTREGAHAPLWSPDGRKLFYVATGEKFRLVSVDVETTPTVAFGNPVVLVPEMLHGLALSERWYDVTPDRKHIVVNVPGEPDPRSRHVEVILNWFGELERVVPSS